MSTATRPPHASADRVRGHVEALAGSIGERNVFRPEALHRAEAYIRDAFGQSGLEVVDQRYDAWGVPCANLEGNVPGASRPERILLVGAHYDSVRGSPGADDNASGVAALLELGRMLAETPASVTVRLVAFVNEEPPFFFTRLQGSRVYARAARQRGDPIRLMLSLEMLGYYCDRPGCQGYPPLLRFFFPGTGNYLAFVSNFRSRGPTRRLARAFRSAGTLPAESAAVPALVPGVAWSDHLSFWMNRYRAAMVTDTAFFRNPHYHEASDLPDTLDYTRLAAATEGLYAALCSAEAESL